MSTSPHPPLNTILTYGAPKIAFGSMNALFIAYLMKFATDVLYIAPATMGVILAASRIWDAFSDPLVGHWSDRTESKIGRRRIWLYASAIPCGIGLIMVWSPPHDLDGLALALWVALSLIIWETATTAFFIPHGALGLEMATSYHERTRLFGYVQMITAVGMILGMGSLQLMNAAEDKRLLATQVSLAAAVLIALSIILATRFLPERPQIKPVRDYRLFRSLMDVFKNPHARILLIVFGFETLGSATVGILVPYLSEYVLDISQYMVMLLVAYSLPQFALAPLWVYLSNRFGKRNVWLVATVGATCTYVAFYWASGNGVYLWVLGVLLGVFVGCGAVIAPSMQADIIDWDEYQTGQRKEGAYYAVWNLVRKGAGSLTALIVGLGLQLTDFVPNAEQSEATKLVIHRMFAFLPGVCFALGTLVLWRYRLNETRVDDIQSGLLAKASDSRS